jgi:hypothetical protein
MTVGVVQKTGVPFSPPSRTPHGSILDYATIIEDVSFLDPVGLVWSYNCIGIDVDEVACAGFKGLTKRFDPPSSVDGAMFVVQGGVTCKPFGFSGDDPALRAAFNVQEAEGVSIGLHDALFDTAVDLTPGTGTSVSPIIALGLLEGYGYSRYSGQPIIHLGPSMVSQLAVTNAIKVEGTKITTALGTPVAVASGNETKTAGKLDQDQWAFVTGAIVLARGPVTLESQLNRTTNDISVLYERLYVAGIDCLVGKVKVKVY